jgi:hypothetical protein
MDNMRTRNARGQRPPKLTMADLLFAVVATAAMIVSSCFISGTRCAVVAQLLWQWAYQCFIFRKNNFYRLVSMT